MLIRNLLAEPCVLMHRHTQFTALTCTSAVNEVVVARQLKHAACRTARVERRHRRLLLSHTQAPPVALEQTEASRGIAVARAIGGREAVGGGSGVHSARGNICRPSASRAMPPGDPTLLAAPALGLVEWSASLILPRRRCYLRMDPTCRLNAISCNICGHAQLWGIGRHIQEENQCCLGFCTLHTARPIAHLRHSQVDYRSAACPPVRSTCSVCKTLRCAQDAAQAASGAGEPRGVMWRRRLREERRAPRQPSCAAAGADGRNRCSREKYVL